MNTWGFSICVHICTVTNVGTPDNNKTLYRYLGENTYIFGLNFADKCVPKGKKIVATKMIRG